MGSNAFHWAVFPLLLLFLSLPSEAGRWDTFLRRPSDAGGDDRTSGVDDASGTRWAVLIAGSSNFGNYRHQADVCHAFQVMKNGGLKEENIIVFMYDDIAFDEDNPRPGVIINHPQGKDVYAGVPKDYVGKDVNVNNFFAAILGNKSALTGGSGKVVNSGPEDHIFIYYSDHGGAGVLGMPTRPSLYANDFVDVLKQKHASGSYKSMVIYIEACESGSIFEGLLPENINIYATTASNSTESSWGTYCPDYDHQSSSAPEFWTCLGDLYSISWMENSDEHNLKAETLKQQYNLVKSRTSDNNTYRVGSHVMKYGDLDLDQQHVFLYMGSNPASDNYTLVEDDSVVASMPHIVSQRDADLIYYWHKYHNSHEGSSKKLHAQRELHDVMSHRMHVDNSVGLIGKLLFGMEAGMEILEEIRLRGLPLVDDWKCLKSMVRIFETHCGSLSQYGLKHMRAFANICNAGIDEQTMGRVSAEVCPQIPYTAWSSLDGGFSA